MSEKSIYATLCKHGEVSDLFCVETDETFFVNEKLFWLSVFLITICQNKERAAKQMVIVKVIRKNGKGKYYGMYNILVIFTF